MIVQIIFFAIYIASSIISYIYFNDNYTCKLRPINSILISASLYLIAFTTNIIFDNTLVVNAISFCVINIVYSKISFNISIKSSLFHASIITAIMSLSEIFIEKIASLIINIPVKSYNFDSTALIILGASSKILYLLICKLVSHYFSYKKNNEKAKDKLSLLILFPIIIEILLGLFFYASVKYQFSKSLNILCACISIISIFFCCFIFIYNRKIKIQEQEFIKMQTEFQKVELDKTFYDLLEKTNEDQRILIHDIKHHLSAIGAMSSVEDIRNYLGNVQEDFESCQFIGKSKNKMLDLIMNKYYKICQIKGIKYYVDVRSSNLSFIEDNDLISMLGNLFDNAVFAAEKVINPTIEFTLKRERNFVILSIINSSFGMPKTYGDTLITTKPNTLVHGHGVKSVERTATMYDGICHWEYINDSGTFRFNIIFNSTKVLKI